MLVCFYAPQCRLLKFDAVSIIRQMSLSLSLMSRLHLVVSCGPATGKPRPGNKDNYLSLTPTDGRTR